MILEDNRKRSTAVGQRKGTQTSNARFSSIVQKVHPQGFAERFGVTEAGLTNRAAEAVHEHQPCSSKS
eukprot:3820302-Amphidinium_carterae.1